MSQNDKKTTVAAKTYTHPRLCQPSQCLVTPRCLDVGCRSLMRCISASTGRTGHSVITTPGVTPLAEDHRQMHTGGRKYARRATPNSGPTHRLCVATRCSRLRSYLSSTGSPGPFSSSTSCCCLAPGPGPGPAGPGPGPAPSGPGPKQSSRSAPVLHAWMRAVLSLWRCRVSCMAPSACDSSSTAAAAGAGRSAAVEGAAGAVRPAPGAAAAAVGASGGAAAAAWVAAASEGAKPAWLLPLPVPAAAPPPKGEGMGPVRCCWGAEGTPTGRKPCVGASAVPDRGGCACVCVGRMSRLTGPHTCCSEPCGTCICCC